MITNNQIDKKVGTKYHQNMQDCMSLFKRMQIINIFQSGMHVTT